MTRGADASDVWRDQTCSSSSHSFYFISVFDSSLPFLSLAISASSAERWWPAVAGVGCGGSVRGGSGSSVRAAFAGR